MGFKKKTYATFNEIVPRKHKKTRKRYIAHSGTKETSSVALLDFDHLKPRKPIKNAEPHLLSQLPTLSLPWFRSDCSKPRKAKTSLWQPYWVVRQLRSYCRFAPSVGISENKTEKTQNHPHWNNR